MKPKRALPGNEAERIMDDRGIESLKIIPVV
jgi:hypothetical protein